MLYKRLENICKPDIATCISKMLRKWNNGRLYDYQYFTEGRINIIFNIKYWHDRRLNKAILRICMINSGLLRQSEGHEVYISSLISSNNIKFFPKVYFYDDSKTIIPYSYMIMEEIDGITLNKDLDKKIFFDIGKTLAKIHNISVISYGKKPLDDNKLSGHEYYKSYFETAIKNCENIDKDVSDSFRELLKTYYDREIYDGRKPVLLHHDFHERNIVIQHGNMIKIIDWDSSRGGIGEYDFIKYKYMNMEKYDSEQIKMFYQGYLVERNIQADVNLCLYEICWLMRMIVFEHQYKTRDSYYPDKKFYYNKYWSYHNDFERIKKSVVSDWKNFFLENIRRDKKDGNRKHDNG